MFNNAGRKIMSIVQIVFWILLILGVIMIILGIAMLAEARSSYYSTGIEGAVGWALILGGGVMILVSYVQCLFYAAFAQLTENVQRMEGSLQRLSGSSQGAQPAPFGPPVCPSCGTQLKNGAAFCPNCGTKVN
ncbi:MAG: zinc-ribbon domain-containing protein [Clostridia bacterium]|nr:zinc-ribbon domain-containing protein [Clostridia bacterium]